MLVLVVRLAWFAAFMFFFTIGVAFFDTWHGELALTIAFIMGLLTAVIQGVDAVIATIKHIRGRT